MLKCFETFPCRVFFGGAKENSTLVQRHLDATQMFQIKAIYRNTAALEKKQTKIYKTFEEKWGEKTFKCHLQEHGGIGKYQEISREIK